MITLLPYKHTAPFPYTSQDNCLDISFAYAIQDEILHIPKEAWDRYNNPFEQKWTLRDKNQLPPNVHQLFQALTSPAFVDHLSTIVGTQLYNDPTKNWWGIHTYDDGDYLDIHCDAGIHPTTGQKKHCTLGIYLSKDWREENGGHLEIWEGTNINQDDRRLERCIEKILPTFNRLILFDNTNHAWHGNPEPVKCKNGEKRIFLTISYLSEIKDGDSREKARFIKRPGDPEDPEKERLRELRVNPDRYKEIYNMMAKYIYLQPRASGLNDILCRINNALQYCERYNRIVLLDTKLSCYKINFADYFEFSNNIIIDSNIIKKISKNRSIYPNVLNNKMDDIIEGTIKYERKLPQQPHDWIYENEVLNIPDQNPTEDIIINIESRDNVNTSFPIFKDLIIKPNVKQYCHNNYQKLPKPYLSIHIRNTDYKCDYKKLYNENKELIHQYKSIYIATDDKSSLEIFKEQGLTIYNFTTFPDIISENLHYSEDISGDIKIKDLMSDLYLMSMSDKLLSNSKGGFINLVKECFNNKDLIKDKFK